MRALAVGLFFALACAARPAAQEQGRPLERITLALPQPPPVIRGVYPVEGTAPKRFGVFTLAPPELPGEIVRVSVPVGELVSRAFRVAAAANRKRQEAAARRRVERALAWFQDQTRPPGN
jgi:hypothetical protein